MFLAPALSLLLAAAPPAVRVFAASANDAVVAGQPDSGILLDLQPGTQVGVAVTIPDRAVLGVVPQGTTLDVFRDDKSTDLRPGARWSLAPGDSPEEVGQPAVVRVFGPVLPRRGASRVVVRGNLVLELGHEPTDSRLPGVTLAPGDITVGGIPLRILSAGAPVMSKPDGDRFAVKLECDPQFASRILDIGLEDDAGSPLVEIAVVAPGRQIRELVLFERAETATVVLRTWSAVENRTITISERVRLGLP